MCRLSYYYATTHGLMEQAKLSEHDLCTLIIGGAIHDFEHQGWNNTFLTETQHEWALRYNDVSVCENHHVAAVFQMIKENRDCNIFEHMSSSEYKDVRKKITKIVVSTDMSLHKGHLDHMKEIADDDSLDITDQNNKTFLMEMCLHVSDLTNPSKRWFESHKWALLVYEEFFVQGDKELELGIPVNSMTDRKNTNIATAQFGFIDYVIRPTFEVFSIYLPSVKIHLDNLTKNRKRWESIKDDCEELKEQGNDLIKEFNKLNDSVEEETSRHETPFQNSAKRTSGLGELLDDNSEGLDNSNYKNSPINLDHPTIANRVETENNA